MSLAEGGRTGRDDPGGVASATTFTGEGMPRHYGDPGGEYGAAANEAAVFDRCERVPLRVSGRAPSDMLKGVLSGRTPAPPERTPGGLVLFDAPYSAALTPKGRLVSDLRLWRDDVDGAETLLLDVPAEGAQALREHLARVMPPRFATVGDAGDLGMITVVGPAAAERLGATLDLAGPAGDPPAPDALADRLAELPEGRGVWVEWVRVIRTEDVSPGGYDVVGPRTHLAGLWERLLEAGVRPAGRGVWHTLRVEAGRPAFGFDMGADTLPYEAGIVERAVDHTKGCYTGQEVIVRIRDRGHVNRHLRGLRLGDGPTPRAGTTLHHGGREVGRVTSTAESPRYGPLALAYVRREVEPGSTVAVGEAEGPAAQVADLAEDWPGSV
ncbi:MAG: aminomethyl transferase family protein [Gemmatimonadetes bacterium]|nr:MAG: aminomethyl transferase family protein [Gemmatimonadota bacterium]